MIGFKENRKILSSETRMLDSVNTLIAAHRKTDDVYASLMEAIGALNDYYPDENDNIRLVTMPIINALINLEEGLAIVTELIGAKR